MITTLSLQGGRRYSQMRSESGPSQISHLPRGSTAGVVVVATLVRRTLHLLGTRAGSRQTQGT